MPLTRSISPPPLKRQHLSSSSSAIAKNTAINATTPRPPPLALSLPSRPITPLSPDQNHIRIFSWNVNGIQPFLQKSITSYFATNSAANSKRQQQRTPSPDSQAIAKEEEVKAAGSPSPSLPPSLRACLKRWKFPHIVCLQEVKIAPGDKRTMAGVRAAVRAPVAPGEHRGAEGEGQREPGYAAFFELPRDRFNARGFGGKVYGVCMLVREDLLEGQNGTQATSPGERGEEGGQDIGRVCGVEWDLEGRVQRLELLEAMVVVFGVYAVNGTENSYRDPKTGMVVGTRHDRKRVFHSKLRDEVLVYEKNGWSVVVAGDLNIARSPLDGFPGIRLAPSHVVNRQDFDGNFMRMPENGGLGMLDAFRQLNGDERKYSYRSRGIPWGSSCDRVDLILISSKAQGALMEADILDDEVERGPSDHVPLYITLNLERLELGTTSKI